MLENMELLRKFSKIYKKGDIICLEHEIGDELFYILDGKVKISKIYRNAESILAYLGKGDTIGEMSLFQTTKRSATAVAEEESNILVFKKNDFDQIIAISPELITQLIMRLSKRYIETESLMNSLIKKDIKSKFATYIKTKSRTDIFYNKNDVCLMLDLDRDTFEEYLEWCCHRGKVELMKDNFKIRDIEWMIKN